MQEKRIILKRKLAYLQRKIKKIGTVMRGTVVLLKNNCGNKECKCYKDKKYKHPAYYFSVTLNNKTKLIYLGKKRLDIATEYSKNYHMICEIMDKMTEINLDLLKLEN